MYLVRTVQNHLVLSTEGFRTQIKNASPENKKNKFCFALFFVYLNTVKDLA